MAIVTIQTIKNWFKTGLKPTQAQFWAVFDSFRHKSHKVPFNDVDGLTDLFNEKADAEALNNHINSADAHADLLAGFLSDADLPSIPLSTFNDDIGATDAIVPLSVFLDTVNGDDDTAKLEIPSKPFKTFESLINSLPNFNGETYSIYFTNGGNVDIKRKIPCRAFNFIAYKSTTLNFTEVMENDGVTNAAYVVTEIGSNNRQIWNFVNENISIKCETTNGDKTFSKGYNYSPVIMRGTINEFKWNTGAGLSLLFYDATDITFNKFYESTSQTVFVANYFGKSNIRIKEFFVRNGYPICGTIDCDFKIDKITQLGTNSLTWITNGRGVNVRYSFQNINIKGWIKFEAKKVEINGVLGDETKIDFQNTLLVSGNMYSKLYNYITYNDFPTKFLNFTGKLSNMNFYVANNIIFQDCTIETDIKLFTQYYNTPVEPKINFIGFNTIIQNNEGDLFGGGSSTKNVLINVNGTLKTNAKSYGDFVEVKYLSSTFKEKLGELVVRSKKDIINRQLNLDITYIIDGEIELLTGEYIEPPAGGNLTLNGYGLEASKIIKNVAGESIMKSPVGGSGGLQMDSLKMVMGTPTTTCFDLTDATGFNAIECVKVNFEGSGSIGVLNGYRQGLWDNIGLFGIMDGIKIEGTWLGGFVTYKVIARNLTGTTGSIFRKGAALSLASRFFTDGNIDVPAGWNIADFEDSNFVNENTFQVQGAIITRNGVFDKTDVNYFPNINEESRASDFVKNEGIENSSVAFQKMKSPDGTVYRLEVDNSGTLTATVN